MIDDLRENYNDRDLVRMFVAAQKDRGTEKFAANLQNALASKWIAEKQKLTELKLTLSGVPTSDALIERYSNNAIQ
ncbi:hypothetical protein ON010_g18778 [Phytophthora cinnamomi]|nr:hypothetical protein ON010_g18778 [Phytophthora cinnamomi]